MTKSYELEKYIIGEIWTSPDIYSNLVRLCAFGGRLSGTESENQARDFIRDSFISYGLRSVRLVPFDYLGWLRGKASLRIVEPSHEELESALSLVYSPNTQPGGLRARVVDVGLGTAAEYAAVGESIKGKFVMASTDSPAGGRRVWCREKYESAVAGDAAGFLFVNHVPGMLAPTGIVSSGRLADIPVVGLSQEDGFAIRRVLNKGGPMELEMQLSNQTKPAQSSNIIGQVPGQRSDAVIVVGAHYDSYDIGPGAVDDASGTALVLETARVFASLAGQLQRTVRFEAYAAEELGLLGSTSYVDGMSDSELSAVDFMLNLDAGALGSMRGLALQGLDDLFPLFAGFAHDMGYPLELSPRVITASDHFAYFKHGVPVASLFARREPGLDRDFLGLGFSHTAADTVDKVSEAELRESAMVAARLLLRLADYKGEIGRNRTSDEIRQILLSADHTGTHAGQHDWPASFGSQVKHVGRATSSQARSQSEAD
jgi:Zn-dependent M28 family amino/carboxypeptidase